MCNRKTDKIRELKKVLGRCNRKVIPHWQKDHLIQAVKLIDSAGGLIYCVACDLVLYELSEEAFPLYCSVLGLALSQGPGGGYDH